MEEYLSLIRGEVFGYLEHVDFDSKNPLLKDGFIFDLVLQHEYQHQETLIYLFQMLDPGKKRRNGSKSPQSISVGADADMVLIPKGLSVSGATEGPFAYDNEFPAHEVELPAFRIDRLPVTNEAFAVFIADGGYDRRELWRSE